ncbi:hypothetical protein PHYBOEH_003143 [Phytophthora boehmeriae]|uniref:DUF4472 domain-containing protein n=1 Tax=Phytophthora boehmeriae TaxID=109152 RepID=A0A8T1WQT1_9STRA|nr:hypothetical protein PHYBOEH_003143 [Phytophthora boehmeriae]
MFGDQHAKQQYREGKQELAVYERSLHDLEGKLAQSGLERRVLREDKDILTAQLNELRSKYRELFDNELSLRTELLACEQEKLALSKAFLAFQLERDTQVQQLDSDKFEAETRLLKAEQLVVEIQQDDATKATQIQDLCAKMNELVADKTRLGGELAMLQKATKAAEEARGADAKKNQQLSLELIIAVNQKQKLQNEMEALTMQLRQHQAQIDAQTAECKQLRSENAVLRDQATAFEVKLESIRKDVVRREMELERAELAVKKEQLETQQAGRNADHQHEHSVKRLNEEIEAQRAAFAQDKRLLELQLERTQHDVARENREKHHATAALTAKNEENEELLLALERTRHDLQAQLEAFRLKLTLLHQPASSEDRLSEAGAGVRALRELLATYQQREQDLRDELDSARSLNLRLARRLRDPAQDTTEPQPNDDSETDRISPIQFKNESEDMEQMRKRLAAAEQRTTMDMKQLSDQAVIIAELESQKADQIQRREKQHQQVASVQSNDNGVHAIAEMHTALARQLEEVRRLTLQQQNQQSERVANNASPSSKDKNTTELSANSNELESLREAKAQLEARLSSNKAHWISLLEQVERRCAELLTKNVMLTEDNESLRQHLKKAHRAQLSKPSRK